MLILCSLVSATPPVDNGNSGSIWTTREDCVAPAPQDENHYNIGEHVWIKGENFAPGEYDWDITGLPGQASCIK